MNETRYYVGRVAWLVFAVGGPLFLIAALIVAMGGTAAIGK